MYMLVNGRVIPDKAKKKILKKTAVPSVNLPKTSHPTLGRKKRSNRLNTVHKTVICDQDDQVSRITQIIFFSCILICWYNCSLIQYTSLQRLKHLEQMLISNVPTLYAVWHLKSATKILQYK